MTSYASNPLAVALLDYFPALLLPESVRLLRHDEQVIDSTAV